MRRLLVGLAALTLAAAVTEATVASAAGSSITVPNKAPAQKAIAWTGTVPVGMDPTGDTCSAGSVLPPEQHKFTVVVPKGAYSKVDATMSLIVDSKPFLNGDFIELLSPTGQSVGTDQQKPEMQVNVADPAPGTWTAVVCQFLPDDRSGGHAYNGSVVIATKKHKH